MKTKPVNLVNLTVCVDANDVTGKDYSWGNTCFTCNAEEIPALKSDLCSQGWLQDGLIEEQWSKETPEGSLYMTLVVQEPIITQVSVHHIDDLFNDLIQ